MSRVPKVFGKTFSTPRRPFEKERLDHELKLVGEFGLRNKREVWRVKYVLAKIRKAARELLTLDEKDPKRMFGGAALIRRLVRMEVLSETDMRLDNILGLKVEDFLERRLQTRVVKMGLAKSMHHARVLIRGCKIRVGKQMVNCPGFIVRKESSKRIQLINQASKRKSRAARKRAKEEDEGDADE